MNADQVEIASIALQLGMFWGMDGKIVRSSRLETQRYSRVFEEKRKVIDARERLREKLAQRKNEDKK